MTYINIPITNAADTRLLTIPHALGNISTRTDDGAQTLLFERLVDHIDDRLIITLEADGQLFEINLGANNEYALTPDLTQFGRIELYITFVSTDGLRRESSNRCTLYVRSFPATDTPPDPPPEPKQWVEEASKDGKIRGRKDGAWEEIKGGGGEDGATFIPEVSPSGNLSWTNNKGLSNPEPVNIKGPKGDDGDDGTAATFAIVETVTGLPGTQAEVSETPESTPQNRKYKVVIPQGATGDKGTNATINGSSTLNIEAGENIAISQDGNTLTIDATDTGIQSAQIHYNEVITQSEYDSLKAYGELDFNTAYDVVEG